MEREKEKADDKKMMSILGLNGDFVKMPTVKTEDLPLPKRRDSLSTATRTVKQIQDAKPTITKSRS